MKRSIENRLMLLQILTGLVLSVLGIYLLKSCISSVRVFTWIQVSCMLDSLLNELLIETRVSSFACHIRKVECLEPL